MSGYQRIHKFEIEDVLPYIGVSNHKFCIPTQEHQVNVRLNSQRMKLMKRVQHCEVCQVKGSYFWLECAGCYSPHFNLYAKNHHGYESMLTMDHILPRSKGGGTIESNVQLLCQRCNQVKKNYLISNDDILRLRFRADPFLLNFVIDAYNLSNPNLIPTIKDLYDNRKKPIIEKDISWFAQYSTKS